VNAEWVIVGSQRPGGGVRVTASIEASFGMLTAVSREAAVGYEPDGWDISVHADDVVTVDAATYPRALEILFRRWAPRDGREPRSITS
jgi:hypothetical protein